MNTDCLEFNYIALLGATANSIVDNMVWGLEKAGKFHSTSITFDYRNYSVLELLILRTEVHKMLCFFIDEPIS